MANYIQDPNNTKKQIPGAPPDNYYDRASAPAANTLTKTPNSVFVNTAGGDIGFYFGSSASFASAAATEGGSTLTGSANYQSFGALTAGTQLGIHPTAWSGSAAASVTFIYKGGLDGSGRP